jgi:hypothetical protein
MNTPSNLRNSQKNAAKHMMLGLSEKISNTMGARVGNGTVKKPQAYKNGIVIFRKDLVSLYNARIMNQTKAEQ